MAGREAVKAERPLLEVGFIARPHGIRGEVVVSLVTNRLERLAPGSRLRLGGQRLPLGGSRPQPRGRRADSAIPAPPGPAPPGPAPRGPAPPGTEAPGTEAPGLEVVSSRRQGETSQGERWIVRFAGIDSREDAEALRGATLMAPAIVDPESLWVHDLVGSTVISQQPAPAAATSPSEAVSSPEAVSQGPGRVLGKVVALEANPASDLLVLESGILIPLHFVVSYATGSPGAPGVITVEIPEGLLEGGL